MIPVPSGVQETLKRNPHNGHLFVFRGRRGRLIKVLWHDGQGMCLFAKRLEHGRFVVATFREWSSDDHAGTARIFAGRDRLASAAAHMASAGSGVSHLAIHKRRAL
jgi:transposase